MAASESDARVAELRKEIARLGRKRAKAMQDARDLLQQIGDVAPDALDAGLEKQEIAELAGMSRVTLNRLLDS